MEERYGTKHKGKLHEFNSVVIPSGTIFGGNRDVARTPIVVGFKVVDTGIFGDVLAEEFGDARPRTYSAIGEAGGDLDLFGELIEDVPEACSQKRIGAD